MSFAMTVKFDTSQWNKYVMKMPARMYVYMFMTLKQCAQLVTNRAKVLAPYLRGDLRRSITNTVDLAKQTATVGTDKIYAPIQEFGGTIRQKTKKGYRIITIPAVNKKTGNKGYLIPALEENEQAILKTFDDYLKTAINI